MKIMGLPNWLHWSAWFVKTFSFVLVSVILIVILLKVHWLPGTGVSVFTNSDGVVIFLFLCLYMCTTITFCFMISSFFSRGTKLIDLFQAHCIYIRMIFCSQYCSNHCWTILVFILYAILIPPTEI